MEELTGADHDGMSSYENMEDDAGKTFFCFVLYINVAMTITFYRYNVNRC